MIPIHQLLSRIRWDPEFGRGTFDLGYFDRVKDRVMIVPLRQVDLIEEDPRAFSLVDGEGEVHRVPFHRVREVYKNGQRIWRRPTR